MRVPQLRGRTAFGSFVLLFTLVGCNAILGDFNSSPDGSTGPLDGSMLSDGSNTGDGAGGASNGTACTTGSQCASGSCADQVCCDNACAGTCESCKLVGKVGTCSPIPVNTDPQAECVPPGSPDAGAPDAAVDLGEAGPSDAATNNAPPPEAGPMPPMPDGGGGLLDASTEGGAGPGYNVPDGGVQINNATCAGSCDGKGGNGAGACQYPDATKTCGTQFCNTSSQSGGFVCDGAGHCNVGLTNCKDYACEGSSCVTACSQASDCLPTDYCDGVACHPKRGHGVNCDTPSQCASGFCDNAACCDTDCSLTTGGNCNLNATKAGDCGCSACATGACGVFYRDADVDGYGDPSVSTVACAAGAPPSGYVTNKLDCDDGDARVNPAQTGYFTSPSSGKHTFDYNCDGSLSKGIPEYPGYFNTSYCGFCTSTSTTPACAINSYSCTSSGAQSQLACAYHGGGIIYQPLASTIKTDIACIGCGYSYCSTAPTPDPYYQQYYAGSGFAGTVGCGASGSFIECGTCSAASGSPSSYSFSETQSCH